MRESVVKLLSRDVEAVEDVALELHNKKKIVRENVMKLLIEYKIEKYTELVQEALQDKKNASLLRSLLRYLKRRETQKV